MTKEVTAALNVVDKVCSDFHGTRADHLAISKSMDIIVEALEPPADKKAKKIEVPKKALPRDRKRKGKGKK